MKHDSQVTIESGGDWKIVLAGSGMVALGVGIALLAAQLGTAALVLSIGGAVGLAAAGIGKGLEHYHRGRALMIAARRGELPATIEGAERWNE